MTLYASKTLYQPVPPLIPSQGAGPSTYLHCGVKKGWPHDHKAEDTYEAPPYTWEQPGATNLYQVLADRRPFGAEKPELVLEVTSIHESKEYAAVSDGQGRALLVLNEDKQTTIANFDTMADAQLAAEALNNHKGY